MKKKIAVVDDSVTSLTITKSILSDLYIVFPLTGGEQLLKFIKTVTPDLILLDLEMPQMSGLDTYHALREAGSDIKVVFLSGNEKSEEYDALLKIGAAGYIQKPIEAKSLIAAVSEYLA